MSLHISDTSFSHLQNEIIILQVGLEDEIKERTREHFTRNRLAADGNFLPLRRKGLSKAPLS